MPTPPSRPDGPHRPIRPGVPTRPVRPQPPDDRPGRPERPERPKPPDDRPGRPERPERPKPPVDEERPGRPARPGFPNLPDPIVGGPITLDPEIIDRLRGEADPLLLVPLRLEYRVVAGRSGAPASIAFRWFPDDGFAEDGIEPPEDEERAAVEEAVAALDGRDWWDVDDEDVLGIVSHLADEVGAIRAVHLLRHRDDAPDTTSRAGRIALLPERVTLFAVTDDEVRELAVGEPITSFSYGDDLFADDSWFVDLDAVVERGMGVRLTEPDTVNAAVEAEWIVAVGLHADDAVDDVERLITDGIATGRFAFLRQDAATNDGDGTAGHELAPGSDLPRFLTDASAHEQGLHDGGSGRSAGTLAEALGLAPRALEPARRSADSGREDAEAMLRVVLPALMEQVPDQTPHLDDVDTDDLIDFFATWICARGSLPAVRFGDEPYGVLPVTRLADLEALPSDDEADEALQGFLGSYATTVGRWLAARADEHVSVISPDGDDPAAALEDALKVSPVSRRLDVDAGDGEGTFPVGCPYVTHDDHQPGEYLEALRTTALSALPDPSADDQDTPLLYRLARRSASRRVGRLAQLAQAGASGQVASQLDTILGRLGEADLRIAPEREADEPEAGGDATGAGRGAATQGPRISARVRRQAEVVGGELAVVRDLSAAVETLSSVQQSSIAQLADRGELSGFDQAVGNRLQWFTRGFGDALRHLARVAERNDGVAQLETLLFETVDVVQHRVDAWAAGLAYRRLTARRRHADVEGLRGGYYGLLGRLRTSSATAETDGYLQAPSPEQATTAAVLRAAHLRFGDEGAFDVDLSSERVRHALGLYELVQRGLSLEEILGLAGERWLHDRRLDRLIAPLRARFPLHDPDDGESLEIRLFDGRRFLDADLEELDLDDDGAAEPLRRLRNALSDDLDALSDLVMAEAVHQRVQGNADAAHAWLQVLSGDVGPAEPTFQRTHRRGHGTAHAVLLLARARQPSGEATPRELAEPSLAAWVTEVLGGLGGREVTVEVSSDGRPGTSMSLAVGADLGMTPWDLVVGGRDEVRLRATVTFLRRWQTDEELATQLGPPPASLPALTGDRSVAVHLDGTDGVEEVLARAGTIRQGLARGRPLQLSDLHATADATRSLHEEETVARLVEAAGALRGRVEELASHVDDLAARLDQDLNAALVHARNLRTLRDDAATGAEVATEAAALHTATDSLHGTLVAVSRTAVPRALLLSASTELRDDPDRFEDDALAVIEHLQRGRRTLSDALTATNDTPRTAPEARGAVRVLTEALQGALDGRALHVLPPYVPRDAAAPELQATSPVGERLADWSTARAGVRAALAFADATDVHTFAVTEAATTDDTGADVGDPRDEVVSPRSRFAGTVLSPSDDPAALDAVVGVVIDEWVESVPSREQVTGIAINHDTPRNEAPNALLLCEPPTTALRRWDASEAATMVVETLRWMKVRALTTEVAAPLGSLLAGANQVARRGGDADDAQPRVPWQQLRWELLPVDLGSGQFVLTDGIDADMLNEAISRRRR